MRCVKPEDVLLPFGEDLRQLRANAEAEARRIISLGGMVRSQWSSASRQSKDRLFGNKIRDLFELFNHR